MSLPNERPAPYIAQWLQGAGWVAVPQALCLCGLRLNLKAPLWQSPYTQGLHTEKDAVWQERKAQLTRALLRQLATWGRKTALRWAQRQRERERTLEPLFV